MKILVPGRGYQELTYNLVHRSLGLGSGEAFNETKETLPLPFKEFCERMGWGYPLPPAGTPEAEKWLDEHCPKL